MAAFVMHEISQNWKDIEHYAIFQEGTQLLNVDENSIYMLFHL